MFQYVPQCSKQNKSVFFFLKFEAKHASEPPRPTGGEDRRAERKINVPNVPESLRRD
jgi:hypothetical protein